MRIACARCCCRSAAGVHPPQTHTQKHLVLHAEVVCCHEHGSCECDGSHSKQEECGPQPPLLGATTCSQPYQQQTVGRKVEEVSALSFLSREASTPRPSAGGLQLLMVSHRLLLLLHPLLPCWIHIHIFIHIVLSLWLKRMLYGRSADLRKLDQAHRFWPTSTIGMGSSASQTKRVPEIY